MLQAVHTAKHLSTAALFTYTHFSQIDCTRFQMTGFFSVPCFFIVCTHFLLVTIILLYLDLNTGKKMKTHVIYLSCGIAVWTDSNAFFSLRRDFFSSRMLHSQKNIFLCALVCDKTCRPTLSNRSNTVFCRRPLTPAAGSSYSVSKIILIF